MSSLDDALAAIWERSKPILRDRLVAVEAATDAVGRGTPCDEARAAGVRAAHQLAGSLGTFGLHEGSDVARELEQVFDGTGDAARAPELTARLRSLLAPRLA